MKSAQLARDAARQDGDGDAERRCMRCRLESVRLEELIDRVRHRTGQIDTEMQEIEANEREARSQRAQADARFEQLDAELSPRQEAVESARLHLRGSPIERCVPRATSSACSTRRASTVEFALNSNRERER